MLIKNEILELPQDVTRMIMELPSGERKKRRVEDIRATEIRENIAS